MNSNSGIRTKSSPGIPRILREMEIFRSAVFATLFFTALFLVVLGALYALSGNPTRAETAYAILRFNLVLIILLGFYLLYRV